MTTCPVECVNIACTQPDWLQTHESFVLTFTASIGAGVGVLLTYFLRSRCTEISFCGIRCRRQPLVEAV